MHLWTRLRTLACLAAWLLPACWQEASSADLLSRIEVYKENDVGVIHIHLNRPVIYTRHFPSEHSYLVHLYFNDLSLDRGNWGAAMQMHGSGRPNDEFMRSPPNDIVPVFWVAYNNHGTHDLSLDPYHLLVQFSQAVHYKIMPDPDNQGFLIFVLSTDTPAAKTPPAKPAKTPTEKSADPAPAKTELPTTNPPDPD